MAGNYSTTKYDFNTALAGGQSPGRPFASDSPVTELVIPGGLSLLNPTS